ncbi:hypothetical protein [Streptomyces mirabilis]
MKPSAHWVHCRPWPQAGGQTANGAPVQIWDSTGGANQHWNFR